MNINFTEICENRFPEFKEGTGAFNVRMFSDSRCRIMQGRLEPHSSIGLHTHETNCEIIFVLEGHGKCLCDDVTEVLKPGDVHYCPKGHSHSLINDSDADLVVAAVVPEQ